MNDIGKVYIFKNDPPVFHKGMEIVMHGHIPWWRRLWRWVTRYKPTVQRIAYVDHTNGIIGIENE